MQCTKTLTKAAKQTPCSTLGKAVQAMLANNFQLTSEGHV